MIVHVKIGNVSWCQFDGKICAKLQEMARQEKDNLTLTCAYESEEAGQKAVDFINQRLHWFEVEEKARVVQSYCDQRESEEWE